LKGEFGEETMTIQVHETPGTPRFKIVCPNNEDKVPIASHSRYRSGVGMLLYLIEYLIPDLANIVCELTNFMDDARVVSYKEIIRVIRFVLDTRDTCLSFKPNLGDENCELVVYSDIYRAGDVENRISVIGFIIYWLGVPIYWRSRGQKGMTMSDSEAKNAVISASVKEIRFIFCLL
jgi:hypothetical protein